MMESGERSMYIGKCNARPVHQLLTVTEVDEEQRRGRRAAGDVMRLLSLRLLSAVLLYITGR
jgi:hypothetical protein